MLVFPPRFLERTDRQDVLDDVANSRRLSPDERGEVLEALCELAAEQTAQHAQPERVLKWRDPLPEGSEILVARLRREYRKHHG